MANIPKVSNGMTVWASFFRILLGDALRLDLQTNGLWPEFEKVSERTLKKSYPAARWYTSGVWPRNQTVFNPRRPLGGLYWHRLRRQFDPHI